jgi:hypothetical protein
LQREVVTITGLLGTLPDTVIGKLGLVLPKEQVIFVVPPATPVTRPLLEPPVPTVAVDGDEDAHVARAVRLGRLGPELDHDPLQLNCNVDPTDTVLPTVDVTEIEVSVATVTLNWGVVKTAPPPAEQSLKEMVKVEAPVPVGVPDIAPPDRDRPVGRLPEATVQFVYVFPVHGTPPRPMTEALYGTFW